MKRPGLLIILGAALAGPAAADADTDRLAAAQAQWQAAGIDSYRYAYQKYCDCYRDEPPETVVAVEAGRIARVFHLHDDSEREVPAREDSLDLYWTIDDLFAKLAGAYSGEATVRVEYEPTWGYPVSLFIDYDTGFTGDETDLRLTRFEPL